MHGDTLQYMLMMGNIIHLILLYHVSVKLPPTPKFFVPAGDSVLLTGIEKLYCLDVHAMYLRHCLDAHLSLQSMFIGVDWGESKFYINPLQYTYIDVNTYTSKQAPLPHTWIEVDTWTLK